MTDQREDVKPVFWWDGDTTELCSAFELKKTAYHTIPLYTQPQSAVPEGWKLVPIEPTNWMRTQGGEGIDDCSVKETWRRMLDAAPQPQSAE